MTKPCPLLWLDLETTGTNPDDQIIEIAACITHADAPFERIDDEHFHHVLAPVSPFVVGDFVLRMHTGNGLWNEVMHAGSTTVRDVERQLVSYIGRHCGGSKVTLAGSGVARFDYVMLQRWMPKVANRLTYYTFDTGVVRRWLQACGQPVSERTSDHRAWGDVRAALEQARIFSAKASTPGHFVCATCLGRIDGPMVPTHGTRVVHYPECPIVDS